MTFDVKDIVVLTHKQASALLAAHHATSPQERFYAVHEYVSDAHVLGKTYQWWRRILDDQRLVLIGPFK